MCALHRFHKVAYWRTVGEHNVDINTKPLRMKPARVCNAMRAIKRVMRRDRVKHTAAIGMDHLARFEKEMFDILFLDPAPANVDFNLGNGAL